MKNKLYILLSLFFVISESLFGQGKEMFYFVFDEKIIIEPTEEIVVRFDNKISEVKGLVQSPNSMIIDSFTIVCPVKDAKFKLDDIVSQYSVYKVGEAKLYPTNEIIFRLLGDDKSKLQELLSKFQLEIVKNRPRYIVVKPKSKNVNIITLANDLHETRLFQYCHPNFIMEYTN